MHFHKYDALNSMGILLSYLEEFITCVISDVLRKKVIMVLSQNSLPIKIITQVVFL